MFIDTLEIIVVCRVFILLVRRYDELDCNDNVIEMTTNNMELTIFRSRVQYTASASTTVIFEVTKTSNNTFNEWFH